MVPNLKLLSVKSAETFRSLPRQMAVTLPKLDNSVQFRLLVWIVLFTIFGHPK